MKIGELSGLTSVPTKTIRYYEEIGVLPPARRSQNGYRDYGPDAADRLAFVKDAQATGLTLGEISTVLRLRGSGEPTCDHVRRLLADHLERLDSRIEALRATRRRLAEMLRRAEHLDPAECVDPIRCQVVGRRVPEVAAGSRERRGNPTAG
jgi:DNA-binding transcriptional MerR regulator